MIRAVEFVAQIHTTGRPQIYRCDDGVTRVCKAARPYPAHNVADLATEQIAGRLGVALGAPVLPDPTVVYLGADAIAAAEAAGGDMWGLQPGPTSATRYLPDAGPVICLAADPPPFWERSPAGMRLEVLTQWIGSRWAFQLVEHAGDYLAVDLADLRGDPHPWWTGHGPAPRYPLALLTLGAFEFIDEVDNFEQAMSDETITAAVEALPAEWVTAPERATWRRYLRGRRDLMLRPLRHLREDQRLRERK